MRKANRWKTSPSRSLVNQPATKLVPGSKAILNKGLNMSITSLGAGLSARATPQPQATPQTGQAQAPSREIQQLRPHHGHGVGKPPVSTDPGSITTASTTGTTLNQLV